MRAFVLVSFYCNSFLVRWSLACSLYHKAVNIIPTYDAAIQCPSIKAASYPGHTLNQCLYFAFFHS